MGDAKPLAAMTRAQVLAAIAAREAAVEQSVTELGEFMQQVMARLPMQRRNGRTIEDMVQRYWPPTTVG